MGGVVKGSLHAGRKGEGTAKHNDHEWMSEDKRNVEILTFPYSGDIDFTPEPERIISSGTIKLAMRELDLQGQCYADELMFYEQCFGGTLAILNENRRRHREYKKIKTMEQWRACKNHKPSEYVLQIGNIKCSTPKDVLRKSMKELMEWEKKTLGRNYAVISAAGHWDESTPHYHERGVFLHWKDGNPYPDIKNALKQAGIPLPDPKKKESKNNSRKMQYDSMKREAWLDIIEKNLPKDYTLNRNVDKDRKLGHMGVDAYKEYMRAMDDVEFEDLIVNVEREQIEQREADVQKKEDALQEREIAMAQEMAERETELEFEMHCRRQKQENEMAEREACLRADEIALEARTAILNQQDLNNMAMRQNLIKLQNTLDDRESELNNAIGAYNHLLEYGRMWEKQANDRRRNARTEYGRMMDGWQRNQTPQSGYTLQP